MPYSAIWTFSCITYYEFFNFLKLFGAKWYVCHPNNFMRGPTPPPPGTCPTPGNRWRFVHAVRWVPAIKADALSVFHSWGHIMIRVITILLFKAKLSPKHFPVSVFIYKWIKILIIKTLSCCMSLVYMLFLNIWSQFWCMLKLNCFSVVLQCFLFSVVRLD